MLYNEKYRTLKKVTEEYTRKKKKATHAHGLKESFENCKFFPKAIYRFYSVTNKIPTPFLRGKEKNKLKCYLLAQQTNYS